MSVYRALGYEQWSSPIGFSILSFSNLCMVKVFLAVKDTSVCLISADIFCSLKKAVALLYTFFIVFSELHALI
jgi:hypothetical protein